MISNLWTFALTIVVVSGTSLQRETPDTPAAAIWRAGIEEILRSRGADRFAVFDETVGSCGTGATEPCLVWRPAEAASQGVAPEDLARVGAAFDARPVPISGVNLPQVAWMRRADVEAVYRHFGNPEALWPEFYARFPGTGGYILVGAPALDEAQQRAWLLLELSRLGGGERVLLSLQREGSRWSVTRTFVLWKV